MLEKMKNHLSSIHLCPCAECQENPTGSLAKLHESINCVVAELNEKNRRLFVGLLAQQLGHGSIQEMSRVTGLSRVTIRRGRNELAQGETSSNRRIRMAGGGRKAAEKKSRHCSRRLTT